MASKYGIVGIVLLASSLSYGRDYIEEKPCGEASVVQGYSCSEAQVEFRFKNCLVKSEPQIATGKTCNDNLMTAFFEKEGVRYEASFTKSQNNWGATIWTNTGSVKQLVVKADSLPAKKTDEKKISEKKSEKKILAKKSQTPKVLLASSINEKKAEDLEQKRLPTSLPAVVTPPPAPSAAAPENNLKFSGFFDFRFTNLSRDSRADSSGSPESGFGLEDGAIYLNYQKDSLSFLLDVPFRRLKNSDVGVNNAPNASPNGNMVWGNDKAQAYVKYTASANFEVALGQFDTVYGVEVNDSKDRYFSKEGLVYSYLLPVTHTGALLSYNYNGGYVRFLTANPNNKGSLGTSQTGDTNYEYGALIGYANDVIRGQLGYLTRPIDKASGIGGGKRALIDATAGATLGKVSFDVEYSILSDDSKNTLTPGDTSDKEMDGIGALALVSYNFTDAWSLGARFEHLEKDPGQTGILKEDSYGLSAHYKWLKSLETRFEFIQTRYQQVALPADTLTDNRIDISNIFSF